MDRNPAKEDDKTTIGRVGQGNQFATMEEDSSFW